MVTKTISLRKKAYDRLKRLKGEKSFSDVVLELTKKTKKDFSNLIDKDIKVDWEEVKEARKRRKEDEKRERLLFGH